jgi:hypothetical protein
MPVIPFNKVVDKKRIIEKRRAEEEERHKGSLTPKKLARTTSIEQHNSNKSCKVFEQSHAALISLFCSSSSSGGHLRSVSVQTQK